MIHRKTNHYCICSRVDTLADLTIGSSIPKAGNIFEKETRFIYLLSSPKKVALLGIVDFGCVVFKLCGAVEVLEGVGGQRQDHA